MMQADENDAKAPALRVIPSDMRVTTAKTSKKKLSEKGHLEDEDSGQRTQ